MVRGALFVFIAFIILSMTALAAYSGAETDAVQSGGVGTPVLNESFSGATSGYQVAEVDDNVTLSPERELVVRDSNGNRLDERDYTWNAKNGTLTTFDGTGTGEIDYVVYEPTGTQNAVRDVGLLPANDAMVLFVGAFFFIAVLLMLGRVA